MYRQSSENQFQSPQENYLTILGNLFQQNSNHDSIKEKITKLVRKVQGLTYSAIVDPEEKYVHKLGTYVEDSDLFGYIGKLLNNKQSQFLYEHQRGEATIKSNIKPPPEPEPEPSEELLQQVENVLSNVDLPLSLFKRNDNYWSINNPKTIEAQQYLKKLRQQDQNFKKQIKKKRDEIIKQKEQVRSKTIEVVKSQEETKRKQLQDKINQKIEQLKMNDYNRKKTISQSIEFIKERGLPLFKKIERQFKEKVQIPTLQQKKRKLNELRQIVRSVPLQQIHSHRQRYQKQKSEHQPRKIINEPVTISFKSHFYEQIKNIATSRVDQIQSNISLCQKKLDYSRMVKENHMPSVDELKKEEIYSRIKLMNKRKARAKKIRKQQKGSDDEDDEQEEEEEQEQEEPEPEEDEEGDSDEQKPQKDDQYEPTQKQRYKMGLNYLKMAKKLAAKKQDSNKSTQNQTLAKRVNTAAENKSISFGETLDNKQGQQAVDPNNKRQKFVWVSKYDQEQKIQERIKYKNYLRQIAKGNQSVDLMDTSQIKNLIEKSIGDRSRVKSRLEQNRKNFDIDGEIMYHTNLENKIRNIEERAKNQEELLKFKRVNRAEKIRKKMAIDDAVVDTIKARLLMMNKTLDV